MPGTRDTLILEQDIAARQLDDLHPKIGTRLQKIVDKTVIDTIYLESIPITPSSSSVRLDLLLLDQPQATGLAFGVLTDKRHEIFTRVQDEAYLDMAGQKVTVELDFTASLLFPGQMTTGSTQCTTVGDPGDVQVGDVVRIQGQGTVAPFSSIILSKVPLGPNFILTFQNIFVQGITQIYSIERIARWNALFRDSANALFLVPDALVDIGVFKRVYLADIAETFGNQPLGDRPQFAPDGGFNVGPPGSPFSSSILELLLDPGDTFLWFHGINFDIPVLTWWVEWPGYPTIRFYYGLQVSPGTFFEGQVDAVPTIDGTAPVQFQHIDGDSILIKNRNTVTHRIKAVVFRPM